MLVVVGTGLSFAIVAISANVENTSILDLGVHGLRQMLYAFTSATNKKGSALRSPD